jgi:hypothetical protein
MSTGDGGKKEDRWDTGELGRDEKYARVADDVDDDAIDAALDLVPVSIRLQRSLIEDFKMIARQQGIGYQPLMRQILTRFAVAETRQMANDLLKEQKKHARLNKQRKKKTRPQRKRA